MTIGDQIASRGWLTGSVIPDDMLQKIASFIGKCGESPQDLADDEWFVIISQTCDLVVKKLASEPYVEVLRCKPVQGRARPEFRDLRSTRRLDFRPNVETFGELVLSAHATEDRFFVPRSLLAEYDPDPARKLDSISVLKIMHWIALRAVRPAWPEAFVRRLENERKALVGILEPLNDKIAEVRVAIHRRDEELQQSDPYIVTIYFVVDEQVWNTDPEGRKSVHRAFAQFVEVLGRCDGIEVDQAGSEPISGGDFSWQLVQLTDLWNFANLSERDPS